MKQTYKSSNKPRRRFRVTPEWVSFTIASFIVAIVIGLVLFIWVTQDHQPPVLSVTINSGIRQEQGQYYVPFSIENMGGGTAESVQVIGELRIDGEVEESGEQQIDFLSSGETEEGAFVFSRNPAQGDLSIRVASYKLP